jgi:argininosuccinate lyase
MNNAFKAEPSVIVGMLTSLATALIGLAVAFGADITDDQQNAILGAIAAVVPIIFLMSVVIRQFVYSPKSAEKIADTQYAAGVPPTEPQPEIPPPGEV